MRRSFPAAILAIVLGVVASLVIFVVVAREAAAKETFSWDVIVFQHVYTGVTPWPSQSDSRETDLIPNQLLLVGRLADEQTLIVIVALVILALLLGRTPRRAAFFAAATAVAGLGPLLKEGFQRPSPWGTPGDYVFPSGHALGSMAVAAAVVALLWNTRWRWPAFVLSVPLVVAIGIAAVSDGGHWPSDVVGGWSLALAWVSIVWLILGRRVLRDASTPERADDASRSPAPSVRQRREGRGSGLGSR
jgi:membrane-associated phospholipid phosphatase